MSVRTSTSEYLLALIENKRPTDRIILRVLFFCLIATGIYYVISVNNRFVITTPTQGGTLVEGIIGIPRFVNPTLAITRADQDVVALLYSGLMKIDQSGTLVPDIAESITLSEAGTTYTILLKKNYSFHDGTPLTTRDVIFTINLMRDPDLKSPLRGNWNDVEIEEVNEYEFRIVLAEPYTPFIENFTFGILPHHIWSNLPIEQLPFSQYNTEPIGSGPFMIDKVNRDASGLISGYLLVPDPKRATRPNLDSVELKFYQNEAQLIEAFEQKQINATVFLPSVVIKSLSPDEYSTINQPLPRIFGVFFNQNRSAALRDASARKALDVAIDRTALLETALNGYGVPTTKPIVLSHRTLVLEDTAIEAQATSSTEAAINILTTGGWRKNAGGLWEKRIDGENETLSVTIRTGNSSLFNTTANTIADDWRKLGVEVQVEQYEQTGLVQSVIRSRDFQALLFGLDMNRLQDLYPFWHSSQKDDPGLNISQYTSVAVDRLLETARITQDQDEQLRIITEISELIATEVPAIFLYAPSVTYVIDADIETTPMTMLGRPADRFMNISNWHAKTDVVWPIFQSLQ